MSTYAGERCDADGAADFVAFHLRKRETLHRDDSLLGSKADSRLIEALDRLHGTIAAKTIFIKK